MSYFIALITFIAFIALIAYIAFIAFIRALLITDLSKAKSVIQH